MKKVNFKIVPQTGIRVVENTDRKYILLSDFLADSRYPDNIQITIDELKLVQSGEKTFKEVFEDVYSIVPIGVHNGEFECDKDTAYFISREPDHYPSMEMPMLELIELLEEWKVFMS